MHEAAVYGPLKLRLAAPDDADLAILYGAEQAGMFDGCGCEEGARGGVARVARYAEAASATTPTLLVDAGEWLADDADGNGQQTVAVQTANAWMVRGLVDGGWDALNVGWRDLRYLAGASFPEVAVSANLEAAGRPAPNRWRVVERGGLKVGVVGVSSPGRIGTVPEGYSWSDPIDALMQAVPELARQVDVVVVLGYDLGSRGREAVSIDGVDVFVDASAWRETWAPLIARDAVWVRPLAQGTRLGELRVRVEGGRIAGLLDRKVVLDEKMPLDPTLAKYGAALRSGRAPE